MALLVNKNMKIAIKTKLTKQGIIGRIEKLFTDESIKFKSDSDSICSQRVALTILGIDPRKYSRKNWLGINPFTYISQIKVSISEIKDNNVILNISINQTRAVVLLLIALSLFAGVAFQLPEAWIGILFFSFFASLSTSYIFWLCIHRLIKREIINSIIDQK